MIIPGADANVQRAFDDIERRLRSLENNSSAATKSELERAMNKVAVDIAQATRKPNTLDFNDVFRGGAAHAIGYVPDPPSDFPEGQHYLGSDGYWVPLLDGYVRLAEPGGGGRSLAQAVVEVHGSLAVTGAVSCETMRTRNLISTAPPTIPQPYVALSDTGNQTIGTASVTALTFSTEDSDTFGMHDSTNPSRITVSVPGKYLFTFNGLWAADATGYRAHYWYLDGALYTYSVTYPSTGSATNTGVSMSILADLAAGQYMEVKALHNKGSDLNFQYRYYHAVRVSA